MLVAMTFKQFWKKRERGEKSCHPKISNAMIKMIKFCVLLLIGNVNISTLTNDDGAETSQVGNNTAVPLESPNGKVSCIQVNDFSKSHILLWQHIKVEG